MAMPKSILEMLNKSTLAASASSTVAECDSVNLTEASQLLIEAIVTFQAGSSGNVIIHLRASSVDADTEFGQAVDYGAAEDGYFTVTCVAGEIERKSVPVWCDALYLRVVAENNNDDTVDVIVNAVYQEVSPT